MEIYGHATINVGELLPAISQPLEDLPKFRDPRLSLLGSHRPVSVDLAAHGRTRAHEINKLQGVVLTPPREALTVHLSFYFRSWPVRLLLLA
jgi:hypothetical protein